MQKKILVLVSNPKGTSNLNLLPEIRDLQEALQRSQHRECFTVEWRVAKHQTDLRRYILDIKPQIIHFCGHGTDQGLVLEDDTGTAKVVTNEVLSDLLRTFADRIECVLLNACDSENLADALAQHINYVIGMNQEVYDDAAIAFAEGFYDTLGAGEFYERAFEIGKNAVLGKASSRGVSRKVTVEGKEGSPFKAQNQEHLIPVLKINPNPTIIKPLWLSPEVEQDAVRQLLGAIESGFNTIKLFHADEPIVLKDQYIPVQVTLERRYQHTVETTGGYAESEAELKRIYALKGSNEDEVKEEIKRQQIAWEEARRQQARIVVLADPGMGKSTLLRKEVWTTVQQAYKDLDDVKPLKNITLPLLIRLSTLADEMAAMPTEEAILKIIQERHSNLLKNHKNAEVVAFLNGFLKEQLLGGKALLLLDALDEVPDGKRNKLLEKLDEFAKAYPTCPIVGTSRIVGYGGRLVDGAKDMEIVPFNQKQTEQYIETWFRNAPLKDESVSARGLIQALRERPQIAGLAQNPLLLSLICSLYQRDRLTLPTRRGQIYEQSVMCMLGEWNQTRLDYNDDRTTAKIRLLEALAYHFTCEGQEVFDYEDLYDWLESYLEDSDAPRDLRDDKIGNLIAELSESDGILQKLYRDNKKGGQYLFLHRTFQEYFTASYVKRAVKKNKKNPAYVTELVRKYCWNYDWHETLTLLAGLMENPMVLIEAIATEKDDIFQTQLLLAGRCIAECREISHPLIDEIIDRIYQFWLAYPDAPFIQSVMVAIGQTWVKLVQSLQTSLNNENRYVRESAVAALGQIGSDKAIHALIVALKDKDSDIRRSAAEALGRIGSDKAVDVLITALNDENSGVRGHVATALGQIGSDKAIHAFIVALKDEDSGIRRSAAWGLGRIGSDKAVDVLIAALNDEDRYVRRSVATALGQIGNDKAVDALIVALNDEDEDIYVRVDVAEALGQIGSDKAIDVLIAALNDEDTYVSGKAREALRRTGTDKAIDVLIAALKNWHSGVRKNAAFELGSIGSDKAVDALITALNDENSSVRWNVVDALGQISSDKAVDVLIAALNDENSSVRGHVATVLGQTGSDKAVDVLISALNDENSSVRWNVVEALGQTGSDKAVDVLISALNDENYDVSRNAAEALGQIGTDKVVDALIVAVNDEKSFAREEAAEALGQIGIDKAGQIGTDKAINALIVAVNDGSHEVREKAAEALGRIGSDKAIPALTTALNRRRSFTSNKKAAEALGRIGTDKAVDALIAAINHRDSYVRWEVGKALGQLGSDKAVDVLITALNNENGVREEAAEVLVHLDSDKVVDALIVALNDENRSVREKAVKVLEQIGNVACLGKLLQSSEPTLIYRPDVFPLTRTLAVRLRKKGLPFIPVYPELLLTPATTDGAEA